MILPEFNSYVKSHSDIYIGYIVSLFSGTGGISLIITASTLEFMGLLAGLALTICSIILTIILTVKAWWGYKKIRADIESSNINNNANSTKE